MTAKMLRAAITFGFCLLLSDLPAWGQQEFEEPGGYLVVGGLTAWDDFADKSGTPVDESLGFEIKGGYRFTRHIAAEVDANFLSGFDMEVQLNLPPGEPAPDPADLTIDGGLFTVNAKGILPFGRIQPFGLVGIGGMWARLRTTYPVGTVCTPGFWGWYCNGAYARLGSSGAFAMKLGGGVDFYINEDWALSVDVSYVLPFGDLEDLRYVNLGWGAVMRF